MNKFSRPLKVLCFLTIALNGASLCASALPLNFAGDPVFFMGPVGQALGGAVYSHKSFHDNLLLNPAAGSFSTSYGADGSFSTVARTLGASIFDTKSTTYGGGLTYLRREVDSGDITTPLKAGTLEQTYQSFGLSVFGKLHEMFAIGVTGKYSMRSDTGTKNLNGESWNGDVGAAFRLNEKVGFGIVYKNLMGDKKDIEFSTLGGGADLEVIPGLRVTGSVEKYSHSSEIPKYGVPDADKISWSIGAQYSHAASGVSLRGAFRNSGPWDSEIMFGGLGYRAEAFHVNYAYGKVSKGDDFDIHTFGLGGVF